MIRQTIEVQLKGSDLKQIRNKLGLSLAETAKQIDISARSIARWEASKEEVEEWKYRLYRTLKALPKKK